MRFVDRRGWPKGPWDNEPDKIVWQDHETGMMCMMHRNPVGAWCGYVGVLSGMKHYGKEVHELWALDTHGGVTYADSCAIIREDGGGVGINSSVEFPPLWWIGFDCSHGFDYRPGCRYNHRGVQAYKSKDYVIREVEKLAKRIHEDL